MTERRVERADIERFRQALIEFGGEASLEQLAEHAGAGVTTPQVASTLDWSATILAAAGASPHPDYTLDGIDLLPVLTGRQEPLDRTIFWRTTQRTRQAAVRRHGWKYVRDEDGEHLFDLIRDPGERQDRKSDQTEVFERLKVALAAWEQDMLPAVPLPALG